MEASEDRRLCEEARIYYYDLLCPDEAAVPLSVRQHVAACPACGEQVRRLRETLFPPEQASSGIASSDEETIEMLAEQFRRLDAPVICSDARRCLPELALRSPGIRIPTPVTVHVDHCCQCRRDLRLLRDLDLRADQLRRLGRLFRTRGDDGTLSLPSPSGDLDGPWSRPATGTPGRDDLPGAAPGPVPAAGAGVVCDDVTPADLFDVAVPPETPPGERHVVVTAHVKGCRVCQGRAQALRRTVCGIVERADSGIETVYHAQEDAQDGAGRIQAPYRYPVSVEVVCGGSDAARDADELPKTSPAPSRGQRAFPAMLGRVAVIVVAVIGLAVLRTTAPTASGTNDNEVLRALAKVKNVHTVKTGPGGRLMQELWIARGSNRLMIKTPGECVLYDFNRNRKSTIDFKTQARTFVPLSQPERNKMRMRMVSSVESVRELISPENRWSDPREAGEGDKGLEIREVSRTEQVRKGALRSRWMVYIDTATGLPRRTECSNCLPWQQEWNLVATTVYTYPTNPEMDEGIRELFPDA